MSNAWKPLSVREGGWPEYDALHEGVPIWLVDSLQKWVASRLTWTSRDGGRQYYTGSLHEIERRLRRQLNWKTTSTALKSVLEFALVDPARFLDVLDFLLANKDVPEETATGLEKMLRQGGSAWKVVNRSGGWCLERRVDAVVTKLTEELMTQDRPGAHLELAWHAAYGRSPDPSTAYRESVRAVEAAAKPVVSPNDATATLGKMNGAIKAARDRFSVTLSPKEMDPVDGLLGMMELLWTAQLDRHGTDDEAVPLTVTPKEAEAAVHLAATLVHWFTSGVVTRT